MGSLYRSFIEYLDIACVQVTMRFVDCPDWQAQASKAITAAQEPHEPRTFVFKNLKVTYLLCYHAVCLHIQPEFSAMLLCSAVYSSYTIALLLQKTLTSCTHDVVYVTTSKTYIALVVAAQTPGQLEHTRCGGIAAQILKALGTQGITGLFQMESELIFPQDIVCSNPACGSKYFSRVPVTTENESGQKCGEFSNCICVRHS